MEWASFRVNLKDPYMEGELSVLLKVGVPVIKSQVTSDKLPVFPLTKQFQNQQNSYLVLRLKGIKQNK